MKILIILILLGTYRPSIAENISSLTSQSNMSHPKSESYASIINQSSEKAWAQLVKSIANKPEILNLLDQPLEQIKPAIKLIAPEKMGKIMSVRNRIHLTPDSWKDHIMVIGKLATKAGKVLVTNKTLGTLLHQLSSASERKDYISALRKIAYYSFLYNNDPDLEKLEDEWKQVEPPIKRYLKKSKVLKD